MDFRYGRQDGDCQHWVPSTSAHQNNLVLPFEGLGFTDVNISSRRDHLESAKGMPFMELLNIASGNPPIPPHWPSAESAATATASSHGGVEVLDDSFIWTQSQTDSNTPHFLASEVRLESDGSLPCSNPSIEDNGPMNETPQYQQKASVQPKGVKISIDLNKKHRKQKPKIKVHTPKVLVTGKPKRTPKPKTPKPKTPRQPRSNESLLGKKKYVRKKGVKILEEKGLSNDHPVHKHPKRTCKQSLNFSSVPQSREENITSEGISHQLQNGDGQGLPVDSNLNSEDCESSSRVNEHSKPESNLASLSQQDSSLTNSNVEVQTGQSSFRVYHRVLRSNPCLRESRKLGPNFPKICKQRRASRKRALEGQWAIISQKHYVTSSAKRCVLLELCNQIAKAEMRMLLPRQVKKEIIKHQKSFYCVLDLCYSFIEVKKKRSKRFIRGCRQISFYLKELSPMPSIEECFEGRKQTETFAEVGFDESKQSETLTKTTIFEDGKRSETTEKEDIFDGRNGTEDCKTPEKEEIFEGRNGTEDCTALGICCCMNELVGVEDKKKVVKRKRAQKKKNNKALTNAALKKALPEEIMDALVEKFKDLSLYEKPSLPKVDLDPETLVMWNHIMETGSFSYEKDHFLITDRAETSSPSDEKNKFWEDERAMFRGRASSFVWKMDEVQGDRRFTKWKASVADSVIGVLLTQNVTDRLSSSAYMKLAAQYPPQPNSKNETCPKDSANNQELAKSPEESTGSTCDSPSKELYINGEKRAEGLASPTDSVKGSHNILPYERESKAPQSKQKQNKGKAQKNAAFDCESFIRKYCKKERGERSPSTMDSLDYDAIRAAKVEEIANIISKRGMHNQIARIIKGFLDRVIKEIGSVDLEWLRTAPPNEVKDYLLTFERLGLKSVECVRLLNLQHQAFPVDTNIARVAVRLGWVPLETLPENLYLHDLEKYPLMDAVQKYLWPRLCKLSHEELYELHYHMITFGKVFCTKKSPNCNACPLRGECKHFASAFASAKLRLPGPRDKRIMRSRTQTKNPFETKSSTLPLHMYNASGARIQNPFTIKPTLSLPMANKLPRSRYQKQSCEPIIEEPVSEPEDNEDKGSSIPDIEDLYSDEDESNIPVIRLNVEALTENIEQFIDESKVTIAGADLSQALVTLSPEAASIPQPKLKLEARLRTEHLVYELPDSHPLLEVMQLDKREPDDPCPYLLAIWTTPGSEQDSITVPGTLLIPCRTAMRGRFPLNGTYFQVNEVFADKESSECPIRVPRKLLWHQRRRILYCAANTSSIFRGLSTREIQYCFWRGFVCVRGFDRRTREPAHLAEKFHKGTVQSKNQKAEEDDYEEF